MCGFNAFHSIFETKSLCDLCCRTMASSCLVSTIHMFNTYYIVAWTDLLVQVFPIVRRCCVFSLVKAFEYSMRSCWWVPFISSLGSQYPIETDSTTAWICLHLKKVICLSSIRWNRGFSGLRSHSIAYSIFKIRPWLNFVLKNKETCMWRCWCHIALI